MASLLILGRDRLSHPDSICVLPERLPPLGKIGQSAEGGIALDDLAETDGETVLWPIGRAAEELPVALIIVADEEDRMILVDDGLGRERGPILALVERPRAVVGQQGLEVFEARDELGMPRISASRIRPDALEDRELVALVEPACKAEMVPVVLSLHLAEADGITFQDDAGLVPDLRIGCHP